MTRHLRGLAGRRTAPPAPVGAGVPAAALPRGAPGRAGTARAGSWATPTWGAHNWDPNMLHRLVHPAAGEARTRAGTAPLPPHHPRHRLPSDRRRLIGCASALAFEVVSTGSFQNGLRHDRGQRRSMPHRSPRAAAPGLRRGASPATAAPMSTPSAIETIVKPAVPRSTRATAVAPDELRQPDHRQHHRHQQPERGQEQHQKDGAAGTRSSQNATTVITVAPTKPPTSPPRKWLSACSPTHATYTLRDSQGSAARADEVEVGADAHRAAPQDAHPPAGCPCAGRRPARGGGRPASGRPRCRRRARRPGYAGDEPRGPGDRVAIGQLDDRRRQHAPGQERDQRRNENSNGETTYPARVARNTTTDTSAAATTGSSTPRLHHRRPSSARRPTTRRGPRT